MKLVQYNECLVSIVDTDGLVLQHQGISSHGAYYAPMRFPVFKGLNAVPVVKFKLDWNDLSHSPTTSNL